MIVARSPEELAPLERPLAITVGVFDGVHRGHRAVLGALQREAAGAGAAAVVVILDPHPRAVLGGTAAPPLLTTPEERVELLAREGLDAVLVHRFDRATAALGPEEFLDRLMPPRGRLAVLVIGYDFRMGKDREGGYEELSARGRAKAFRVVRVGPEGGEIPVSSTRIRSLIEAGCVAEAAELLGHRYRIRGKVVKGRGIGRTLDFPTANVDVENTRKLLPGFGVYAVLVRFLDRDGRTHPGVMNRGTRPTFGDTEPVVEVHLPGFRGDLLGSILALELVERIREEQSFPGPEALAARIEEDVEEARKILEDLEI